MDRNLEKKAEPVSTDVIVRSIMIRPAKISSIKRLSDISAIDFGVNALLEEKLKVRDVRQRSNSKWTDILSGVEIAVDSIFIGGSRNFDSDGEMEEQIRR